MRPLLNAVMCCCNGIGLNRRRPKGESLLEVVFAIGIVATLALTTAQSQIAQSRMQRAVHERMTAMALLDALAERRRMQMNASMSIGASLATWQRRAASTLPDGRLTVRRVSAIADRLSISWQVRATRHADAGPTLRTRRCIDPDPQRQCESIDVPVGEASTA